MEKASKFLSVSQKEWLKTFWTFLFSTVLSIGGDAVMQAFANGNYSLGAIHWKEIIAAIFIAVITRIKQTLLTNSNGDVLVKEVTAPTNKAF